MTRPATTPPAGTIDRLETALAAARDAGRVVMASFGARLAVDVKADGSPVTDADRAAEDALRAAIRARHGDDGVLGEEFGEDGGTSGWRWILDPIDGTAAFVAGVPLFAVLVAAEFEGEPVAGVLHFPALGDTVWASAGGGAWRNGVRATISDTASLAHARVLTTELARRPYASLDDGRASTARRLRDGWTRLAERAALARTWGDAYGYALVATGRADAMIDPALSIWDAAPLRVVIEEAGGVFTDAHGNATHAGGSAIATNRALHAAVLRSINEEGNT